MNNYAITSEELATSLEKSSAALVAAGNSLEEAEALEIAGNTILQDSDTVANALKVLSMRIRGTSAKALEEAGEDTEGLIENASKLYNTVKELTKTQNNPEGVEIIDKENNAYKSTYEILLEISKVWDQLDSAKQAALLETIAGKTRGAAAAAILQNTDILESAYNDAMNNAEGAGAEALEASLDSIQKKIEIFTNELKHFGTELISSDFIKFIVDLGTSILEVADNFGELNTIIGAGTFAIAFNKGFDIRNLKEYYQDIKSAFTPQKDLLDYGKVGRFARKNANFDKIDMSKVNKFIELLNSGKDASEAFVESMENASNETMDFAADLLDGSGNALSEFTKGSKLAEVGMQLFSSAIMAGATILVEIGIKALVKWINSNKEAVDSLKAVSEEQNKFNDTIEDSIKKYEELSKKLDNIASGTSEYINIKDELLSTQNNIIDLLVDEYDKIDLVNGGYNEQLAILKNIQREKAKTFTGDKDNKENYKKNKKYLDKYNHESIYGEDVNDQIIKQILIDNGFKEIKTDTEYTFSYIGTRGSTYTDFNNILSELSNYGYDVNNPIYTEIEGRLENLDLSRIEDALSNIETYNEMMALGNNEYSNKYNSLEDAVNKYNSALASHNQDNVNEAEANLNQIISDIDINNISDEKIKEAFEKLLLKVSEELLQSNEWYKNISNAPDNSKFQKGLYTESEISAALKSDNESEASTYTKKLADTAGVNLDNIDEVERFIGLLKDMGFMMSEEIPDDSQKISQALSKAKTLSDELSSSLDSAYSAYNTLINPNSKPEDILNALYAINDAANGLLNEIDWENILSDGNFSGDEINSVLDQLGQSWKDKILDVFDFNELPNNFEPFINSLLDSIEAEKKATAEFDNMTNSIDKLQSSYSILKEALTEMNSGRGLSLDTLQQLITADENYIQMLMVENGQLKINTDKYKELVAIQLNELKAKLDKAAAAEIDALAEAANANATANATAEIKEETAAMWENTSAAIARAKANENVDMSDVNNIVKKYTSIWNAMVKKYSGNFDSFMTSPGSASGGEDTKKYKEKLDAEITLLEKQLEVGYIDFKEYMQKRRDLVEKYYADNLITSKEYYEELEALYESQLEIYDRVIRAVNKVINDQIKKYQDQQKALDDQIKALQEANEERQDAIDLSKKLYELERAKNQRTRLVYRDGQLQYLNNPDEIRNAQSEVDNAILNKKVKDLEKQKDAIQKLIDALEEYKEKWNEIADIWDDMKDAKLAESVLGPGWQDKILNMDPTIYENFKTDYVNLEKLIDENAVNVAKANYDEITNAIAAAANQICAAIGALLPKEEEENKEFRPYSNPNFDYKQYISPYYNNPEQSKPPYYSPNYTEEPELRPYSSPNATKYNPPSLSVDITANDEVTPVIEDIENTKIEVLADIDGNDYVSPEIEEITSQTYESIPIDITGNDYVSSEVQTIESQKPDDIQIDITGNNTDAKSKIDDVNKISIKDKILKIFGNNDEAIQSANEVNNISITDKVVNFVVNGLDKLKEAAGWLSGVFGRDVNVDIQSGKSEVSGTVGTAFVKGKDITNKYDGTALVGETGQEMLVRNGKYTLVGQHGAEFTDIKPNDIIFNSDQTEQILKYGHINSRGKAYADGKNITPLSFSDPEKYEMLNSFIPKIHDSTDIIKGSVLNIDSSIKKLTKQIDVINMPYSPSEQTPIITITNPTFQCTGVTGDEVLHQIEKQFEGLFVSAYQKSMKK